MGAALAVLMRTPGADVDLVYPKKENWRVGWAPVIETFCFCLEGCKRGVFSSTQEQLCVIG